jgi:uncharacterized protein YdaU (DUF1376 family)
MNYYPHHIGDFTRDTAHLSMLEEGAYRRMIDVYYGSEKPLPAESGKLYRLVRAQSSSERKAVDTVLGEFFEKRDDGWHQKRCDEEICKAHEKSQKARHSAQQKWSKRDANADANADADAMRTQSERKANGMLTNNQEPRTKENQDQKRAASPPPDPLWGEGLSVLTGAGMKIESARAFIGKCLKSWDANTVLDALREASGTAEPRSYALSLMAGKPKKQLQRGADPTVGSI